MNSAFLILRDILLLRRGPQDLPYSTQLLTSAVAASIVVQAIAGAVLVNATATVIVVSAFISVGLTLVALNLMLGIRRLRNRFIQTATALLGCNLLFSIISIPAALILPTKPTSPEQMPMLALLLAPLAFACAIWQLAVNAHILRHSLDIPFWGGVAMVLLWVFVAAVLAGVSGASALA